MLLSSFYRQIIPKLLTLSETKKKRVMGKGDKKSKKGKISNNSYGARRPRKIKKRPTIEEKIKVNKKK
jgi:30S ribosomal protein S31